MKWALSFIYRLQDEVQVLRFLQNCQRLLYDNAYRPESGIHLETN